MPFPWPGHWPTAASGIIELTLRTDSALESLKRIANEVPDILVGAGTILTPGQADAAVAAGAQFLVSPGVTPSLLDHMLQLDVPVLPGVATVGEVMAVLERGMTAMKFFPAGPGRRPGLPRRHRSAHPAGAVLPDRRDQPGLRAGLPVAAECLLRRRQLADPAQRIESEDWQQITRLAEGAAALRTK